MFESYLLNNLLDCILIILCPWFASTEKLTNDFLYFSLIPVIIKGINTTPCKSYLKADLDKTFIYNENKNKSGVYLWVNISNNNSYVGSSYNLSKRFTWYYSFNNLNRLLEKSASLIGRAYSTSTSPSVVTVKKYTNADVEKLQILNDNKEKSGIYRWSIKSRLIAILVVVLI